MAAASGNDVRLEQGEDDFRTFDSAQDRNRRGDHRVAEEQRSASEADDQKYTSYPARCGKDERQQRHRASFAVVVRTHDYQHVLDRHHEDDGPEHKRQHA